MPIVLGDKVTAGIERIGFCNKCLWERRLVVDQLMRRKFFHHPVYGRVTYEEAAYRDVREHDCEIHLASKARVHALMRGVDEYR